MKTPEMKKPFRDVPKSQEEKMNESLSLATLVGSQEIHITDETENLSNQLEYQKGLIKDYDQQLDNLEKQKDSANDIFTIAKNPEKFIDIDTKSKEDIQKIINKIQEEKDDETKLMNKIKIQLAKLKNIIPKNPQDN